MYTSVKYSSKHYKKRKGSSVDDKTDGFQEGRTILKYSMTRQRDKTSLTMESSHMTSTSFDLISRNNTNIRTKENRLLFGVLLDVKFITNPDTLATKYFKLCEV
jgi:hypothetical protein